MSNLVFFAHLTRSHQQVREVSGHRLYGNTANILLYIISMPIPDKGVGCIVRNVGISHGRISRLKWVLSRHLGCDDRAFTEGHCSRMDVGCLAQMYAG